MDLIETRLDVIVLVWIGVTLIGFITSLGSLVLLLYEVNQHPLALYVPEIATMKRFNIVMESFRLSAQSLGLLVGMTYIFGITEGQAVGWVLVAMVTILTVNSLIEFILTERLLFKRERKTR